MSFLSILSGRNRISAAGKHSFRWQGGRRRGDRTPGEPETATNADSEAHFHRMMRREQKRSERSQKQLLLMAIGIQDSLGTKDDVKLLQRVAECVTENVRDTDLPGWFERNAVFNVLFTELGDIDIHLATDAIRKKVSACLQKSFSGNQLHKISVSINPFPQQREPVTNKGAKYAWDTRRDSDCSLVAGISSVPRDHRVASHSACGGSDTTNTALREGQKRCIDFESAESEKTPILATLRPAKAQQQETQAG